MKKGIKIITLLIIVILIGIVYYQKVELNKEYSTKKDIDNEKMLEVRIIDKYNKMKELYENPRAEKYVEVDLSIDGNYYHDVGIRTKGNHIYNLLELYDYDNYSFKVRLDYRNKEQKYNGMTELHLNTTFYDDTGIREHLIYDIYNRMGIETQQYYFGHLYIGDMDRGLITIVEMLNEEYMQDKYNSENGNIYKPMRVTNDDYGGSDLNYYGDNLNLYKGIFNNTKTDKTTDEDKARLVKIIKNINRTSDTNVIENSFMDFDKVIKMVAINKVLINQDVFYRSDFKKFLHI